MFQSALTYTISTTAEEMVQLYTRQSNWIRTHLFDLTGDRNFGEGQPHCPDALICLLARTAVGQSIISAPFQDGSAPSLPDLTCSDISFLSGA